LQRPSYPFLIKDSSTISSNHSWRFMFTPQSFNAGHGSKLIVMVTNWPSLCSTHSTLLTLQRLIPIRFGIIPNGNGHSTSFKPLLPCTRILLYFIFFAPSHVLNID
jgi:hypothetical protein